MKATHVKFPIFKYSFSGFPEMLKSIGYIPLWVLAYFIIYYIFSGFCGVVYSDKDVSSVIGDILTLKLSVFDDGKGLEKLFQIKDLIELGLPVFLAYFTVVPIAIARSQLSSEKTRLGHIGFGAIEFVVAGNILIIFVPAMLILIGIFVAIQNVNTVYDTYQASSRELPWYMTVYILLLLLSLVLLPFALLYVAIKSSLALPYSVDRGRIGVLQSWRATKGLFWHLFASQFLAYLWLLIFLIALDSAALVAFASIKFDMDPSKVFSESVSNKLTLDTFIFYFIISLSAIPMSLITITPVVRIYKDLRKGGLFDAA